MRLFIATILSLFHFSLQYSNCFHTGGPKVNNSVGMGGGDEDSRSCSIDFHPECKVQMEFLTTDKEGCYKAGNIVRCVCKGRHCNSDFKKYQADATAIDSSLSKCDYSHYLSFPSPTLARDLGTTVYPFGKNSTIYKNGVWRSIDRTLSAPGQKGVCGIRFYPDCTIEMAPSDYDSVIFLEKCSKLGNGAAYCACMYKDNCNSDIAYWKEEVYWTLKDVNFSHCNWEDFPEYPAVMGTTPGPRTPRATTKTVETSTASGKNHKQTTKSQVSVNTTESVKAEPSSVFSVRCSVLFPLVVFRVL